jgi:hypothetical protein
VFDGWAGFWSRNVRNLLLLPRRQQLQLTPTGSSDEAL